MCDRTHGPIRIRAKHQGRTLGWWQNVRDDRRSQYAWTSASIRMRYVLLEPALDLPINYVGMPKVGTRIAIDGDIAPWIATEIQEPGRFLRRSVELS